MGRAGWVATSASLLLLLAGCDSTDPADPETRRADPSGPSSARSSASDRDRWDRDAMWDYRPSAPPLTDEFVPARGPRELATRLTHSEDLSRSRNTAPWLRDSGAFEAQLLYRQLARTPAWDDRARAAIAPRYRADLTDHLTARRALRGILTTLSDEIPAWEIVKQASTLDLRSFYREGQRTYGVPWEVLAAINLVETGFGKIRGLSTAGAQGPMQFIPSTWAAYGVGDINDPHDAILAAARYLAANGGDSPDGLEAALYRYNNHPGYVTGVLAYASILGRRPGALRAMVYWQIVYLSTIGDVWLPIKYLGTAPVPVRAYVRQHPERHLGTATN